MSTDHHGSFDVTESTEYSGETMKLLLERASCRDFKEKPIPEDLLYSVLNAGVHAATGGNLQPFSIIRIENNDMKQWFADNCGQKFIAKTPTSLLFCIDLHRLKRWAALCNAPFAADRAFRHFWISFQDTIIAAQNICTAADAMGLGSVYIGTVMEFMQEMRERLELPDGVLPVVLLCLGWPKHYPDPRKKLDVNVLVHSEKYHDPTDQELLEAFEKKYPDRKTDITDQHMETFRTVCEETEGRELADRFVETVKEKGFFNMAQLYFGLHYRASMMAEGNTDILKVIKRAGLNFWE